MKLDDGTVVPNWPVDVNAEVTGFDSGIQNQRGALQFLNGVLYVPYGGPTTATAGPTTARSSASRSPARRRRRGGTRRRRRAASGGRARCRPTAPPSSPSPGTPRGPAARGAAARPCIRLAPGPTFSGDTADYYAPTNWQVPRRQRHRPRRRQRDAPRHAGGAKYPHLVVAGGKDGNLYVLNRDNLGGIGGELLRHAGRRTAR